MKQIQHRNTRLKQKKKLKSSVHAERATSQQLTSALC